MKEYFLNLMKPCCNLSYLEMREFINAVEFNSEENRQEVLQGVTRKGTLTQEAWMLFIGSVPLNDTINLELLQEWSGSECKLTCEQWQRVIGGVYFNTNFDVTFNQKSVYNNITDEASFRQWLENSVNDYGEQNQLQNVEISDFRIEQDDDGYNRVRCNLNATAERINFTYTRNFKKIGNILGLKYVTAFNTFADNIFENDNETLEEISINGAYSFRKFEPKGNLPNLKKLIFNFCDFSDGFILKKDFPSLTRLVIYGCNLTVFNPTKRLPSLVYLQVENNQQLVDFSAINWIWFIPNNGDAQLHHNGVSIENTLLLQRLQQKNWNVAY